MPKEGKMVWPNYSIKDVHEASSYRKARQNVGLEPSFKHGGMVPKYNLGGMVPNRQPMRNPMQRPMGSPRGGMNPRTLAALAQMIDKKRRV